MAIIIPLLLAAPRWFAKEVQVGWIMQVSNAFGQVQGAMSYFVDAYTTIAQWCSVVRRLDGFNRHVSEALDLKSDLMIDNASNIKVGIENVDVFLPNKNKDVLIKDCTIDLMKYQSLLIMGASGVGKSTLLRTLAGLWPYAKGNVYLPKEEEFLFLPQRPYLPLGSLRQAISYPVVEEVISENIVMKK